MTITLNHEKIKKYLQRIAKTKPFINKFNWEGMNFPSDNVDWKQSEKNVTSALNVLYAKKWKYILLVFQNITQIVQNKLFF